MYNGLNNYIKRQDRYTNSTENILSLVNLISSKNKRPENSTFPKRVKCPFATVHRRKKQIVAADQCAVSFVRRIGNVAGVDTVA